MSFFQVEERVKILLKYCDSLSFGGSHRYTIILYFDENNPSLERDQSLMNYIVGDHPIIYVKAVLEDY
jgi:hypothetical protein